MLQAGHEPALPVLCFEWLVIIFFFCSVWMGISYIGETKIVWEQWSASVTTVVYRNTKGMVSRSDKDAHCLSASLKRHLCKMCKMEALEN